MIWGRGQHELEHRQIGEGEGKRGTAEGDGWRGLEEQMRKSGRREMGWELL